MRDFQSVDKNELIIREIEAARHHLNVAFLLVDKDEKDSMLHLCDCTDDMLSLLLDK